MRYEFGIRVQDILKWVFLAVIPLLIITLVILFSNRRLKSEIIEHNRSRCALQKSETKFRKLFDASPISLWEQDLSEVKQRLDEITSQDIDDLQTYLLERPDLVWELAGLIKVLSVNQQTLKLYKAASQDELLSSGITRIFARESHKDFIKVLLTMAANQTSVCTERNHVTLDGANLFVMLYWSVVPGYEDTYSRILVSVVDITELKNVEQKLRNSEIRLKNAQHLAKVGDYVWDLHTGSFSWSDGLYDLMLYPRTEKITLAKVNSQIRHPDDSERINTWINRCLASDDNVLTPSEYRVFRNDGAVRIVRNTGHIERENGRAIRIAGTVQDITEFKQAEEKLHQIQKVESLRNMAGAIAHNFNNMLQSVIGNLEIMELDLPGPENLEQCLNNAIASARQAAELSTSMLTYIGQSSSQRRRLNLSELCRKHLHMIQAVIPPNITLKTDLISSTADICGDDEQIQQALMNLVTNAREAIGDQDGFIHLRVRNISAADISEFCRFPTDSKTGDSDYVCLEVLDTGQEIAPENMGRLFDPFFTTRSPGRGIGLPVVQGITAAHNGCVVVENIPQKGKIFRICLPATKEEAGQMRLETPSAERQWDGGVLIVDDEEMIRTMAGMMLAAVGFEIYKAQDGVEALEIFREHQNNIRLVLCDLTMPHKNGWETLTDLRAINPGIPVILASGYDESQVMIGDHAQKPQVFLHKPFKYQQLKDAVHTALTASYL